MAHLTRGTALALCTLLAACQSTPSTPVPTTSQQPVRLSFAGYVNGEPFVCGRSYDKVGSAASRITPTDFRFYVSDVALLDAAGHATPLTLDQDGAWQYRNVALIDLEDGSGPCRNGTAAAHPQLTGHVPPGDYQGVRFTVGLPMALNHADVTQAPPPLNLTAMFWNWQAGYKFFKFDTSVVQPASAGNTRSAGFPVHVGSTQCSAESPTSPATHCRNSNRVEIQPEPIRPGAPHHRRGHWPPAGAHRPQPQHPRHRCGLHVGPRTTPSATRCCVNMACRLPASRPCRSNCFG